MAQNVAKLTSVKIEDVRVTERIKRGLIYAVLIFGALIVFIPFAWTLSTALKAQDDVFAFPPQWIPDPIVWSNFSEAVTTRPFGRWFLNTLFVVGVSTFGTVVSASIVAFAFARLRWPGRNVLFLILLATMMLPEQVTLIPTFILFRELGWLNTFLPLIVPGFFARNAFYVFLLRQFYMTIPFDLDEAARIDGASHFQIYLYIILPMSKPALAIAAIMFAQFKWKEFLAPLIYLNNSDMFTVSLGLRTFIGETWGTEWNLMMAANIIFMIPLILVFFFAQKYFIQGVVITGVKG
ncbi:carbohydrate ABC transporter permease [Phototrophicus methaneseepsis]|uniref:Carbohydrate ABC transporter permease n=1 Tax=Phototrophicus methaneseepsis TaxID=2710758 RepID=A0A7S8IDF5_9CHLR|nr:carbohydrate ABC transporter permease [Phototrophicus methaneseepsis]QPC81314.1 carbohydrate ABC transporter permease [Phototrophicus methaneseepsis]